METYLLSVVSVAVAAPAAVVAVSPAAAAAAAAAAVAAVVVVVGDGVAVVAAAVAPALVIGGMMLCLAHRWQIHSCGSASAPIVGAAQTTPVHPVPHLRRTLAPL